MTPEKRELLDRLETVVRRGTTEIPVPQEIEAILDQLVPPANGVLPDSLALLAQLVRVVFREPQDLLVTLARQVALVQQVLAEIQALQDRPEMREVPVLRAIRACEARQARLVKRAAPEIRVLQEIAERLEILVRQAERETPGTQEYLDLRDLAGLLEKQVRPVIKDRRVPQELLAERATVVRRAARVRQAIKVLRDRPGILATLDQLARAARQDALDRLGRLATAVDKVLLDQPDRPVTQGKQESPDHSAQDPQDQQVPPADQPEEPAQQETPDQQDPEATRVRPVNGAKLAAQALRETREGRASQALPVIKVLRVQPEIREKLARLADKVPLDLLVTLDRVDSLEIREELAALVTLAYEDRPARLATRVRQVQAVYKVLLEIQDRLVTTARPVKQEEPVPRVIRVLQERAAQLAIQVTRDFQDPQDQPDLQVALDILATQVRRETTAALAQLESLDSPEVPVSRVLLEIRAILDRLARQAQLEPLARPVSPDLSEQAQQARQEAREARQEVRGQLAAREKLARQVLKETRVLRDQLGQRATPEIRETLARLESQASAELPDPPETLDPQAVRAIQEYLDRQVSLVLVDSRALQGALEILGRVGARVTLDQQALRAISARRVRKALADSLASPEARDLMAKLDRLERQGQPDEQVPRVIADRLAELATQAQQALKVLRDRLETQDLRDLVESPETQGRPETQDALDQLETLGRLVTAVKLVSPVLPASPEKQESPDLSEPDQQDPRGHPEDPREEQDQRVTPEELDLPDLMASLVLQDAREIQARLDRTAQLGAQVQLATAERQVPQEILVQLATEAKQEIQGAQDQLARLELTARQALLALVERPASPDPQEIEDLRGRLASLGRWVRLETAEALGLLDQLEDRASPESQAIPARQVLQEFRERLVRLEILGHKESLGEPDRPGTLDLLAQLATKARQAQQAISGIQGRLGVKDKLGQPAIREIKELLVPQVQLVNAVIRAPLDLRESPEKPASPDRSEQDQPDRPARPEDQPEAPVRQDQLVTTGVQAARVLTGVRESLDQLAAGLQGQLATRVRRESQAILGLLEPLVLRVQAGTLATPGTLDRLATPAEQVRLDALEAQDRQVIQAIRETRGKLALLGRLDSPELQGVTGSLAKAETLVRQEILARQARQEIRAQLVRQERKELRDRLEMRETLVQQAIRESLDLLDSVDLSAPREVQEIQVQAVIPEIREKLDRQVSKESPEQLGQRVLQGALEILDRMASPGPPEELVPPARKAAQGIRDLLALLEKLA